MRKFKLLVLFLVIVVAFISCKKSINTSAKDPNWDRDTCARCVMQVYDKIHSAQIVNPDTGERFFFDDMGCANLYLVEKNFDWKDRAIVYYTDGKNGKWIDKKDAIYATEYNTPMAYGVGVFSDKADVIEGKSILSYDDIMDRLIMIKKNKSGLKHGS